MIGFVAWSVYRSFRQERLNRALITALQQRQSVVVIDLLAQGADPNTHEMPPVSPSLQQSLKDLFRRLTGKSSGQKEAGASALTWAVDQGDTVSVQALLARGARDVEARVIDPDGAALETFRPILLVAAKQGNREIVRALLDHGANVEARDSRGETALMKVIEGPEDIISYRHPADIIRFHQMYREVMDLLLDRGADIEAIDTQGKTVLWYATQYRGNVAADESTLTDLLARHADPNHVDKEGRWTPFNTAVYNDDLPLVKAMLAKGADINSTKGESPLLMALEPDTFEDHTHSPDPNNHAPNLPLLRFLLAHGADVHARKRDNDRGLPQVYVASAHPTPLLMAADLAQGASQQKALQLLLAHGADIEERDAYNRTALMVVAEQSVPSIVAFLLDHRASIEARDHAGNTALHYAVGADNRNTVALLLKRGAKINARNAVGETPFACAQSDAVKTLLKQQGGHR